MNRLSQLFAGEPRRRELYHVGVSLLFLAAGICAVWFVQSVLEVEGDAILVAFLVVPRAPRGVCATGRRDDDCLIDPNSRSANYSCPLSGDTSLLAGSPFAHHLDDAAS